MLLTDKLLEAQRESARRVEEGKTYSLRLPIVGRVPVPSPRQLALYAALGGLAAIELIDWPVALMMGVGSAIISRQLTDLDEREHELEQVIDSGGRSRVTKAPAKKSTPKKTTPPKARNGQAS